MPLAYIALGSNLADPLSQVRSAVTHLAKLTRSSLLKASSFYRTKAVSAYQQPDYINAVVLLDTELLPEILLNELQCLEREFGRGRDFYHAPRTLDLDLLLYDQMVINSLQLTLPHPRMHLRAFVLAPLLEIAKECLIPGRGKASAWLSAASLQVVDRLPS